MEVSEPSGDNGGTTRGNLDGTNEGGAYKEDKKESRGGTASRRVRGNYPKGVSSTSV